MAYNNRQFSGNGRRFNNQRGGGSNWRNDNRGNYKGGRSFRNNENSNNEQNYELRGIVWGNKFRDEQKEGAPVLQGYATIGGVKFRVAGFLNVGPDYKDDRSAQQEKEAIAQDLNNILLDGQQNLGLAFSLVFEDEAEREAQGYGSGGGQTQRGGAPRGGYQSRSRGRDQQEEEPENVPFNQHGAEEGEADEPQDEAPRPARARRTTAAKASAKSTKTTKSRKASK